MAFGKPHLGRGLEWPSKLQMLEEAIGGKPGLVKDLAFGRRAKADEHVPLEFEFGGTKCSR